MAGWRAIAEVFQDEGVARLGRQQALARRAHGVNSVVRTKGGHLAVRKAKNLLLSTRVVEDAEHYCRDHGTTLSRLVEGFLDRLPKATYGYSKQPKSAIVRRLTGRESRGMRAVLDQYRDYGYEDLIRERNQRLAEEMDEMERRDWVR